MGEVYQATDPKLGRSVAIKLLPEAFSHDAERAARFQREARVLAALNHPHIASIYGIEEAAGLTFLVMELVPGETLADRIKRGPIPVDESLGIAGQIAEALAAAHDSEKGIVHRDLKPANVKITPDGMVKVLDFGLAKAFELEPGHTDVSNSPTMMSIATTGAGVILGTAAYMSPEQAKGRPVDRRTDMFALGCVLYEMLAGRAAFQGDDVHDIMGAVLKSDPDWSRLPAGMPSGVRSLLQLCLAKDRNLRLRDARDACLLLAEARAERPPVGTDSLTRTRGMFRRVLMWSAATSTALALIVAFAVWNLKPPPPLNPVHMAVTLPQGQQLATGGNAPSMDVSPDGARLAYAAVQDGVRRLYLRELGRDEPRLLPGTEGALTPFFSPDGEWIGFTAEGKLKKISAGGGTPVTLADTPALRGARWVPDDTIVFAPTSTSPLMRVSAGGGDPQPVTTLDRPRGETSHRVPFLLPGRKALVFARADGTLSVRNIETGDERDLIQGSHAVAYVPTGHLVYAEGDRLLAVPFDLQQLATTGSPTTILEGVREFSPTGASGYLGAGVLAYVQEGPRGSEQRLVWVDRGGNVSPVAAPPRNYYGTLALSPDGRQAGLRIDDEIWTYDLVRGILSPFSRGDRPIWTPDGKRLAYRAESGGSRVLYWKQADGSGGQEELTRSANRLAGGSWSPDGKVFAFVETSPVSGDDIWVLNVHEDRKPRVVVSVPGDQLEPQFSRDGRWLAYTSSESGRNEVYVQPFPGPGPRVQVSNAGGSHSQWGRNNGELFFLEGESMMAVDVSTRGDFISGAPRRLFQADSTCFAGGTCYGVAPDGRFLMIQPIEPERPVTQINVVLNWYEELKGRLAAPSR